MENDASAKISRSTAIWVALITALGGFATAVATGSNSLFGKKPAPAVVQRWIRVESVEFGRDTSLPPVNRIRLVVQVNGVSYGYPTSVNSIWAPVGTGMPIERYPLAVGQTSYHVKVFGFGLGSDGKVSRYEFRGVSEHSARRIPIQSMTQPLHLSTSEPSGLLIGMTVRYSIE
jgi:hypothetical protein